MLKVNQDSIEELKKELQSQKQQPPFGTAPYEWLSWICQKNSIQMLNNALPLMSKSAISREDIYKIVLNNNIETTACVTAILAWGGMRRNSGFTALSTLKYWLPTCDEIRSGKLSRTEAYDKFMSFRLKDQMKGMGPAFFTKLIFFLMHNQKKQGYIMDQWTAASVNLLSQSSLVKTNKIKNKKSYFEIVSDKNTALDYENFCSFVEDIATDLNRNPVDVELAMFSEGRGNGGWRNYIVNSRIIN